MISFILLSTLALALFLLFYVVVLEKEKMFVFNRYFLLFSLALGFLIPFMELSKPLAPQAQIETLATAIDNFGVLQHEKPSIVEISIPVIQGQRIMNQPKPGFDVEQILIALYLLGLGFFMARFVYQICNLLKAIKINEKSRQSGYTIVLLNIPIQPFAFWKFLFLSKEAYENGQLEPEILSHELCHILEKHTLDVILIEFLKVVFWFNPIFFLYKRYIQLNHEYLADDAVVRLSGKVVDYQRLLLSKVAAIERYAAGFGSSFHFSETKRRLKMVGKETNPLRLRWIQIFTSAFVILVILGLTPVKDGSSWVHNSPTLHQSAKDYEVIIEAATDPGNPYSLNLDRLDVRGLKRAFEQTPENERENLTAFPFLEGLAFEKLISLKESDRAPMVRFIYHAPPEKKKITEDVFDNWKKSKAINLEIDGIETDTDVLNNYSPADFALFEVRGIGEKGFLKKKRYSVKLTTHARFERIFVQQPKKLFEVALLISEEERYSVHYSLRLVRMNEDTKELEEFRPRNFEASILHTFLIVEPKENQFTGSAVIYDVKNQFPMMLEKGRLKFFSTYPTI